MTNLLRFSIPLCIFCTVLAAASCSASHQVLATNGFADLSDADFSGGGPATVRGEWLFRALDADIPVSVPSNWKGLRIPQAGGQSITLDAWGSASYRLELALPDSPERVQDLMLRIGEAGTASTVSLNGRVIARTGTAGSTAGETVPDVRVRYLPVEPVPGINTLEITVSNFDDSNGGGLWGTLTIGKSRDIVRLHYARTIQESLLAGIFVIMCLYYLAIFLYRRSDFALLAFALICAAFFFRQVSTGEKILALVLPEIPWRTLVRIEYLSIFLLAPLYIAFFSLIYPPQRTAPDRVSCVRRHWNCRRPGSRCIACSGFHFHSARISGLLAGHVRLGLVLARPCAPRKKKRFCPPVFELHASCVCRSQ